MRYFVDQFKIQKVLAERGYGSRREIERWINEGKISVNKKPAKLGMLIQMTDEIKLNDNILILRKKVEPIKLLLYHKPIDWICSNSEEKNRKSVYSALPTLSQSKWISIGRLDINTSGLLLFTNNGEFANKLMHPKYQFERRYKVRVFGHISENTISYMKKGVWIDKKIAKFNSIKAIKQTTGKNLWFEVTVNEGRNRLIRKIWQSQKIQVNKLIRIGFATVYLPDNLNTGDCRLLPDSKIQQLLRLIKRQEKP